MTPSLYLPTYTEEIVTEKRILAWSAPEGFVRVCVRACSQTTQGSDPPHLDLRPLFSYSISEPDYLAKDSWFAGRESL